MSMNRSRRKPMNGPSRYGRVGVRTKHQSFPLLSGGSRRCLPGKMAGARLDGTVFAPLAAEAAAHVARMPLGAGDLSPAFAALPVSA